MNIRYIIYCSFFTFFFHPNVSVKSICIWRVYKGEVIPTGYGMTLCGTSFTPCRYGHYIFLVFGPEYGNDNV